MDARGRAGLIVLNLFVNCVSAQWRATCAVLLGPVVHRQDRIDRDEAHRHVVASDIHWLTGVGDVLAGADLMGSSPLQMTHSVEQPLRPPVHAMIAGERHNPKTNLNQRVGDAGIAAHCVSGLGQTGAAGREVHLKLAEAQIRLADAGPHMVKAGCGVVAILRHVTDGDEVDAHLLWSEARRWHAAVPPCGAG